MFTGTVILRNNEWWVKSYIEEREVAIKLHFMDQSIAYQRSINDIIGMQVTYNLTLITKGPYTIQEVQARIFNEATHFLEDEFYIINGIWRIIPVKYLINALKQAPEGIFIPTPENLGIQNGIKEFTAIKPSINHKTLLNSGQLASGIEPEYQEKYIRRFGKSKIPD